MRITAYEKIRLAIYKIQNGVNCGDSIELVAHLIEIHKFLPTFTRIGFTQGLMMLKTCQVTSSGHISRLT